MAANKFATMLHRKTNKLTLILVYALLEWILIVLLLLNSLFSFLIIKFADYFGLQRPCLFCSRIDHVFEPAAKTQDSYRDLLCDHHASQIGQLGYCSNHRKLAESHRMCEDCSSSSRPSSEELPSIAWMQPIGEGSENGEVGKVLKCSCCGVSIDESKLDSPCVLIKPSWGVLDYTHGGSLIAEAGVDEGVDRSRSEFVAEEDEEQGSREIQVGCDVDEGGSAIAVKEDVDEISSGSEVDAVVEKEQDLVKLDDEDGDLCFSLEATTPVDPTSTLGASPDIMPRHLEFFIGHGDYRLFPVELIDSATEENQIQYISQQANRDVVLNFDVEGEVDPTVEKGCRKVPTIRESEDEAEAEVVGVESSELVENARSMVPPKEIVEDELIVTAQAIQIPIPAVDGDDVQETARDMDAHSHPVSEEDNEMQNDEMGADVSIGTEIPDHELIDGHQAHVQEDPSTTSHDSILDTDLDHGSKKVEQEVEFKTISVSMELHEIEEDKVPDTPSSMDSLHQFNRKVLLLERRESGTEESLDGSVISDIEIGELSVEKLSSALRAERKALNALYSELKKEKSTDCDYALIPLLCVHG